VKVRFVAWALVPALVACSSLPETVARPLPVSDYVVSETSVAPVAVPPVSPPQAAAVVYLIQGDGLIGRARVVAQEPTATDAIEALIEGPTPAESARGLRSGLAVPVSIVKDVAIDSGSATVSLSGDLESLPGDEQIPIVGQIVLTLAALEPSMTVQFIRDELPLSVVTPSGESVDRPVTRADFAPLLSR